MELVLCGRRLDVFPMASNSFVSLIPQAQMCVRDGPSNPYVLESEEMWCPDGVPLHLVSVSFLVSFLVFVYRTGAIKTFFSPIKMPWSCN